MAIQPSDIVFTYSGGSTNQDPQESIGGDPSAFQISGDLNNLYDNISNDETLAGNTDYRCIYVFNNNATDKITDVAIFIPTQVPFGASITIGVTSQDEQQEIRVTTASGGSATLSFEGDEITWNHDADLAVWGTNLETALNGLSQLSDVVVTTSVEEGVNVFLITFEVDDGLRNQELIEEISNDFTGAPLITISVIQDGTPVNQIAPLIAVDTAAPDGVSFQVTDIDNPISIGTLFPADGIPVWIQRTTIPGTQPLENDGFTIRVQGSAF